jgi:nucleotide-binding universal stress UspA family protein
MGPRSILVSLSGDTRDSAVLDLASRAADIGNAVVTALYTEETILRAVPHAGWPMPQAFGPVVDLNDESWNALKAELNERRANAARHFNTWQERRESLMPASVGHTKMLVESGAGADLLSMHRLVSDLAIVPLGSGEAAGIIETALGACNCSVLGAPATVGEYAPLEEPILVAWDRSREAARAVRASLPLLKRARRGMVVMTVGRSVGPVTFREGIGYLATHDVDTWAQPVEDGDVGPRLLQCAADRGAGLLVAGADSHSRFREAVFGGVARYIASHATLSAQRSSPIDRRSGRT